MRKQGDMSTSLRDERPIWRMEENIDWRGKNNLTKPFPVIALKCNQQVGYFMLRRQSMCEGEMIIVNQLEVLGWVELISHLKS